MSSQITKTPGVCGGKACIGETRIPVWVIAVLYEAEAAGEAILKAFPHLTHESVIAAIAYANENVTEIQRDIADENTDS